MGLFPRDTSLRAVFVRASGDSTSIAFPEGSGIALDGGEGASDTLLLLVANASFERSAGAAIGPRSSRLDVEAYPYPNPAERSAGTALFSRLAKPAAISIFGERGEAVRTLSCSPESPVWDWDFTDGRGGKVPPGLYYFRVDRGRLAPLYLK